MLKTTFIAILLICSSFALPAQLPSKTDSLERELARHDSEDHHKVQLLFDLAYEYANTNAGKGLEYADKMFALAQKLNQPIHTARALTAKAVNYAVLGKDSLAIADYKTAIRIQKEQGEELRAAIPLTNLANLYYETGAYREALKIYEENLELFEKHGKHENKLTVLNGIGISYFGLGDYPRAIEYYYQTIDLAKSLNNPRFQAHASTNLALIYKRMGKFQEALDNYQLVINFAKQINDNLMLVGALGNMASAYDEMNDSENAIRLYNDALTLARKLGYKRGEGSNLTNLGVIHYGKQEYVRAWQYLSQALLIYQDTPDPSALSSIFGHQARILATAKESDLAQIGISPQRSLKQAETLALKTLDIARDAEDPYRRENAYYNLGVVYEQQKRFKEAMDIYKRYFMLRDSLSGEERKEEIVRLEMQYEMGKRDAEAAAEILRHKTNRNATIIVALVLVLLGITMFFIYKQRQDALKMQQKLNFQTALAETDMKVLRLQMNPHFIFNSLNSISDYISKNDIESADYYLAKFSGLTRRILENSELSAISLSEEIRMLESYMQLEAARLRGKFTYLIQIAANIDPDEVMIPPLILQPSVENSIWHGISGKEGKGKITIEATTDDQNLLCVIEDDGVGRFADSPSNHKQGEKKSFGLSITQERIDLLNNQQNTNAGIRIKDLAQGTRVEIRLPLEIES